MEIKRITEVNRELANKVNNLFDEGKVWDHKQGDLFLSNANNLFLLAFENEEPVGFLTAHCLQRFDKRKAEVLLYETCVHSNFRKRGIGKALVAECKNWAKEVGADEIWVLTEKDNLPAMSLYRSSGGQEEAPGTVMFIYKLS